ncbi:SAM-dependent methyltransferase [Saccharopolyspora lacisalsi]|uniref:SAM-dependent methyltransferase n=1 Tax=Halosaccharopolyspora lacisalsi TaxID=1000566 RepID=A0A839E4K3_9PSEU|nr:class I SAM-dependent methyltransferase [Halosaccharopolyspora lacisalsi]MBA8825848.1 SAM-dependent methyltransferase [Halosaccharopolyspora lacisalsi]
MTDSATGGDPAPAVTDMDFDALYRGERRVTLGQEEFDFEAIPWDIGEPQPLLVELERAGAITGEVLDAGFGRGDNALFLAERGYRVTAFDGAPAAVEQGRQRARERGVDVEFLVSEATTLEGLEQRSFGTVIDSALYHCLGEQQRQRYAAALSRVCGPGSRLHLLCFSDAVPGGFPGPFRISEAELRSAFADGWNINRIEPGHYTTVFTPRALRRQSQGASFEPDSLDTDDSGRIRVPVWHLDAERT